MPDGRVRSQLEHDARCRLLGQQLLRDRARRSLERGRAFHGADRGRAVFPLDVSIRRTLELEHTIVHWSEFDRGGHFAALEAPDLLVGNIRTFFGKLR